MNAVSSALGTSQVLRPADFLAEWGQPGARLLFLLTGSSGAGKTTWCLELTRVAAAAGRRVSGLCSPAVWEDGRKMGIDLVDLHSSLRRRLAIRKPPGAIGEQAGSRDWQFDEQVLQWGNALITPAENDLFILDELGPLEFEHNRGLVNAFVVLDHGGFDLACVVVRPSLLLQAQERWPAARLLDLGELQA